VGGRRGIFWVLGVGDKDFWRKKKHQGGRRFFIISGEGERERRITSIEEGKV